MLPQHQSVFCMENHICQFFSTCNIVGFIVCDRCDFLPACMFSIHEFYFLDLYAVGDSNVVVKKENLDAKQ